MKQIRSWIINVSQNRMGQIISCGLLIGGFVYLFFQTFGLDLADSGLDFQLFIEASGQVASGISPYEGMEESPYSSYLYPPVLAFLIIPLTWVPSPFDGFIWYGLNVAALFGVFYIIESTRQGSEKPKLMLSSALPLFILLLIMYVPLQNQLKNGQVNLIVLFLCIVSVQQYTLKNHIVSACTLALALSVKPLPVFLIVYFIVRQEWKLVSVAVLMCLVFLALPFITMGTHLFSAYQQYFHTMVFVLPEENFPRIVFQIQTTIYDFFAFTANTDSLFLRQVINAVLLLVIIVFDLLWLSKKESNRNTLLVWSVYLFLTLWILPISEKHHLILLFPALYVVGAQALYGQTQTNLLGWGIILFTAMFIIAKSFREVPLYCFVVLILFVLSVIVIKQNQNINEHPSEA